MAEDTRSRRATTCQGERADREGGEERGAERGEERRRGEERVRFNREISNFVKAKLNHPGHN